VPSFSGPIGPRIILKNTENCQPKDIASHTRTHTTSAAFLFLTKLLSLKLLKCLPKANYVAVRNLQKLFSDFHTAKSPETVTQLGN